VLIGLRKVSTCFLTILLFAGFMGTAAARAGVPESKDPIKIVTMGYTGDEIIVFIYGKLIQKLGYNVEFTPTDYLGQFKDLAEGKVHIGSPGWDTTAKADLAAAWATGNVLNMGHMGIRVNEDWWYPLYMKKVCPGLPDWQALKKPDCAKALVTADTAGKARFLSGPVEWGGHDAERIEAFALDFAVVHAESDRGLLDDIIKSVKRRRPIIAWMWEPFWLPAFYPGEFVNWPKYEDLCYDDPSWGENKAMAFDCGRPNGFMWKAAWAGGEVKWPKAYDVYRKLKLDNKTMGELVYSADIDGVDRMTVADQWIADNESIWKPWMN
jgi:glycine betaine/proline transport system substrate-binding protein